MVQQRMEEMKVIKCPQCGDMFEDKGYKKCKCYKCGYEYEPIIIDMNRGIFEAVKRTKGG